jgi:hypothetical protein
MKGYIKLHRSIIDWEWFADDKTFKLFVYLIVSANWEDKSWRGMTIKRGELVTSLKKLSSELGYSINEIRHRLKCLNRDKEIITKSTHQFTHITICKYDDYQDVPHTEAQTDHTLRHKQNTLTKEYKKKEVKEESIKKTKNEYVKMKEASSDPVYRAFIDYLLGNNPTGEALDNCLSFKRPFISEESFSGLVADFGKEKIKEKLEAINNQVDITKKRTLLSSTLRGWCKYTKHGSNT